MNTVRALAAATAFAALVSHATAAEVGIELSRVVKSGDNLNAYVKITNTGEEPVVGAIIQCFAMYDGAPTASGTGTVQDLAPDDSKWVEITIRDVAEAAEIECQTGTVL